MLALSNPRASENGQHAVVAKVLTKDHKPEDPEETRHIEKLGQCGIIRFSPGMPKIWPVVTHAHVHTHHTHTHTHTHTLSISLSQEVE